ncbi:MAG: hypothetical protein ACOC6A_04880 [Chloroflexota bacterium]|jgi:peptidoglycan/LPS O-acetylase OafA/YrhL
MAHNIAFVLIGLGVLAFLAWVAQGFFASGDIPLLVKIAAGAILLGVLVLVGAVAKNRASRARSDRYKEVER